VLKPFASPIDLFTTCVPQKVLDLPCGNSVRTCAVVQSYKHVTRQPTVLLHKFEVAATLYCNYDVALNDFETIEKCIH